MTRSMLPAVAAATVLVLAGGALAQGSNYLGRYDGSWEGGGMVRTDKLPAPVTVSCTVDGTNQGEVSFDLSGNCTAMLVMNRDIGASLDLDKRTGTYTGVYTGSSSGPASLAGTREGDTLRLEVTWGRKIFDDNVATMLIENRGGGSFTMKVIDKIDGKDTTVSDLTFERA